MTEQRQNGPSPNPYYKTLWQKFGDVIKDILDKLKSLLGVYADTKSGAVEADFVAQFSKDVYEQLQDLYLKAFVEAEANYQAAQKAGTANKHLNNRRISYNERAIESHKAKLEEQYSKDASIDLDTLMKRYDKIISIWKSLGGELDSKFLNEWNNKVGKDRAFTVFKAQSGYKYNVELSSMCKKGVPLFEAIDTIVKKEVMKELGTDVLGKEEKEILYDILKSHSFEIPCAICYVYSERDSDENANPAKPLEKYSRQEYNSFGWARAIGALSFNELNDLYAKIQGRTSLRSFKQSSKGEAIIEVNNQPNTTLAVDNVFVFVKGSKSNFAINRVVRFQAETEIEMDILREELYDGRSWSDSYCSFLSQEGLAKEYRREGTESFEQYQQEVRRRSGGQTSRRTDGNNRRSKYRSGYSLSVGEDGEITESNYRTYQERTTYAPTFYSYMGKVVDDIRLEKMGAGGVVSYLKGKGVKDEEIKWSGIEAFLEGKKSVTKAELQEFVAGSQLQIEETISGDVWSMDITDSMKDSVLNEGQAMYQERDPDSISNRSLLANALESAVKEGDEKNLLRNYKTNLRLLEAEQAKLADVRQKAYNLRFKKGRTAEETKTLQKLDFDAKQIATQPSAGVGRRGNSGKINTTLCRLCKQFIEK